MVYFCHRCCKEWAGAPSGIGGFRAKLCPDCERGKWLRHIKNQIRHAWSLLVHPVVIVVALALFPVAVTVSGCHSGTEKQSGQLVVTPQGPHVLTGIGINGHAEQRAGRTIVIPPWGYLTMDGDTVCCFESQSLATTAAKTDSALTACCGRDYALTVVNRMRFDADRPSSLDYRK